MALRVGPIPPKCNVSNHGIANRYSSEWFPYSVAKYHTKFIFCYTKLKNCYSQSGKLGGREVKTSALVSTKREVVGSNPARVACEVFSQTLGKH